MNSIELRRFAARLDSSGILFTTDMLGIVHEYLADLTGENLRAKDFAHVRQRFLETFDEPLEPEELPQNEAEFFKFVASNAIGLVKEPRQVITELFLQVQSDLVEINTRLCQIRERIVALERAPSSHVASHQIGKLRYYLGKNEAAKAEIENFLFSSIKEYALHKCTIFATVIRSFMEPGPYPYAKGQLFSSRDGCDPASFSPCFNKFLDMPIRDYKSRIVPIQNDKVKVATIGRDYIRDNALVDKFRSLATANHILNRRKEVLSRLADHFVSEDFLSFVHMAPLQVEGIFHDYCLEVGISAESLAYAGLGKKLWLLKEKNEIHSLYEYYAFDFPQLRNNIAHGGILEGNLSDQAVLLFLDLLPVCEMTTSDSLPFNRSVKLIEGIEKGSLEDLLDWIDFLETVPDPFYRLTDRILEVKRRYHQPDFWKFIEKVLQSADENGLTKLRNRIVVLKRNGIEAEKCVDVLRKAVAA